MPARVTGAQIDGSARRLRQTSGGVEAPTACSCDDCLRTERLGVRFTSILTARDIASYEPSPASFYALEAQIERLGVRKDKLLHVAQVLFHDQVPPNGCGLPTVWINRCHDNPGWGAIPEPSAAVTADWTCTSMAGFADPVEEHILLDRVRTGPPRRR